MFSVLLLSSPLEASRSAMTKAEARHAHKEATQEADSIVAADGYQLTRCR